MTSFLAMVRVKRRRRGYSRLSLRQKELPELLVRFLRRLFGEIVSARHRSRATNIGRVCLPDVGRLVIAADAAGRAPQQQQRRGDLAPGVEVLGVHGEIDAEGGAVILA